MEDHRLKPMVEHYNVEEFNRLYSETKQLKQKLAYGMDEQRFGLTKEELIAEFDVKLLWVYNKYCEQHDYEVTKAHVINALRLYKCKLLKYTYAKKREPLVNRSYIDSGDNRSEIENLIDVKFEGDDKLISVKKYLKNNMSENAWLIFNIEIDPPLYILDKITGKKVYPLPVNIIADYLGIPAKDVRRYQREIKEATLEARQFFN